MSESATIANEFNKYYSEIGSKLANSIISPLDKDFKDYLKNPVIDEFTFHYVTEEIVSKVIDKLKAKSSIGIDGLSSIDLKGMKHIISKPLTLIINQMFATGIFPIDMKQAKIIPLYKKDENYLLKNYSCLLYTSPSPRDS